MKKDTEKVAKRGAFRSLPPQEALRSPLTRISVKELERKHREGYTRKPVKKGEFDIWQDEQVWPTGQWAAESSAEGLRPPLPEVPSEG